MLSVAKPDLVFVLTPSGMHYEHVKDALLAGSHVLVEKPAAMTPAQIAELQTLSEQCGLMLCVGFQNRFNSAMILLKDAVDRQRFGKIVTATIRLRWCREQDYYNDGWHGTWQQDGGVINQQAIHHVDALRWLLGPIESVCAITGNRLNHLEAEDTLVSVLRFENGALGTIEATTAARPRDFEASISIVGEKGYALIGGIALNEIIEWQFIEKLPEDELARDQYSQEVPNGYGLSHNNLINNVINEIKSGRLLSPVPIEDALATTEFVHALYASDEDHGWVRLSGKPLSLRLGVEEEYIKN